MNKQTCIDCGEDKDLDEGGTIPADVAESFGLPSEFVCGSCITEEQKTMDSMQKPDVSNCGDYMEAAEKTVEYLTWFGKALGEGEDTINVRLDDDEVRFSWEPGPPRWARALMNGHQLGYYKPQVSTDKQPDIRGLDEWNVKTADAGRNLIFQRE